jgi:hypothetical protein
LSRPIYLENILPIGYQKQANTYQWKFKGTVPEDGLSINFFALFIPSLQSELRQFLKANILKLKDATPEEYRSVLRQYYLLLTSDSKPVGSFLSGYFKEVKLTNGKSNFIFTDDKKNVQRIAEQFDILTRDQ